MNRSRLQASLGLSLIEVMVTIVILAFGLMGVAALMALSVRQQHETRLHTQAVFVAEAMMERMRANPLAVWTQSYDGAYDQADEPTGPACDEGNACTPADVAARDRVVWSRELSEFLHGGTGNITCVINSLPPANELLGAPPLDGYCDLSVAWQEIDEDSSDPVPASVAWRFIP